MCPISNMFWGMVNMTFSTYKNTTAWFSVLAPSLVYALSAMPSAPPIALPSLPPSGPFVEEEYVLRDIKAWEERSAVGKETWNRLARCAVKCVSDCKWAGRAGRDGCEWAPLLGLLRAMMDGFGSKPLICYVCVNVWSILWSLSSKKYYRYWCMGPRFGGEMLGRRRGK